MKLYVHLYFRSPHEDYGQYLVAINYEMEIYLVGLVFASPSPLVPLHAQHKKKSGYDLFLLQSEDDL